MRLLSRLVLGAALVGVTTLGAPAQASHECYPEEPCYECVMYPCYPSDWVEFLSQGTVSYEHEYVCVNNIRPQVCVPHHVH